MAKRLSRARGISLIIYQGLPRYNHKNGMHAHVCGRGKGSRHARKLHMPTAGGTAPCSSTAGGAGRGHKHMHAPKHTPAGSTSYTGRAEGKGAHKHAGCSQKKQTKNQVRSTSHTACGVDPTEECEEPNKESQTMQIDKNNERDNPQRRRG